jgi:uncharacterized membrane protein YqjE
MKDFEEDIEVIEEAIEICETIFIALFIGASFLVVAFLLVHSIVNIIYTFDPLIKILSIVSWLLLGFAILCWLIKKEREQI